jgi:asparagine synthetase B (glutamine-hydrolysing)
MCGIGGVVRKNLDFEVSELDITNALCGLQSRGSDATGIAWETDDVSKSWLVLKTNVCAEDFVKLDIYKESLPEIVKSRVILMHTRYATHGKPENNLNNHPIHNADGLIIHNGVVYTGEKIEAQGETDTEQMLLKMQKFGIKDGLSKITGSAAFFYVNFKSGKMYVYAHTSPMEYMKDDNGFVFASTEKVLVDGMRIPKADVKSLKEDIVYRVEDYSKLNGIIKIKRTYGNVYGSYGEDYYNNYKGVTNVNGRNVNYYQGSYKPPCRLPHQTGFDEGFQEG